MAAVTISSFQDPSTRIVNFSATGISVANTAAATEVAMIPAGGRDVIVLGTVGTAAIAGLEIYGAAVAGGTHVKLMSDSELTNSPSLLSWCFPTTPHTTTAAGTFAMRLSGGLAEYKIYAKASTANPTTVSLAGCILPPL